MKKAIVFFLSFIFILGFSTISSPNQAGAAAKVYANCKELNKVYPGGVAKSSVVKNKGGKTKYKPTVNAALYKANEKSDRDKDGIACER